jgi:hypothetical protein
MSKDDAYYFHQTPIELAKKLIDLTPIQAGDIIYEPFKGEGSFYNSFPPAVAKIWTELVDGKDFRDCSDSYDWVITNPPFKLENVEGRVNAFWYLLDYFSDRAKKGIAFLANDTCFCTLTPLRLKKLKEKGWYIQMIHVCAVKKWRGRYFYIVLTKTPSSFYSAIEGNY